MKKQDHPPDNCMICDLHIVQDILSGLDISEYKKYIILKSFLLTSIKCSILFLIASGSGINLLVSCCVTSCTKPLWFICFLSFIIRTMQAYRREGLGTDKKTQCRKKNFEKVKYLHLMLSLFIDTISCSFPLVLVLNS